MNIDSFNLFKEISETKLLQTALSQDSFKLKADGYMDLSVELQNFSGERGFPYKLCLSHYYKQNGDLMRDPDLTILINVEKEIAIPYEFQTDSPPVYRYAIDETKLYPNVMRDLYSFAKFWFKNLKQQGHFNHIDKIVKNDL